MNLDYFLNFWSHYNQTIIQALIVVTLIFIVALVFITLFGSKDDGVGGSQVGLSPELEKSLQKMLENQTKAAVFDFSKPQESGAGGAAAAPSSAVSAASGASAEVMVQLEKLKADMAAKEQRIAELNTQLSQAVGQGAKEIKTDTNGLETRIKELEARLAEYDIISEDIADLSRYKDENEKIKQELATLKGGAPAAPAAAPAAPPPVSAPAAPPVSAAPTAAPPAAPEVDPAVSTAIDDDLMKEFAAAVEGQKAAATPPAGAAPPPGTDNEDLMGQFENFVQKKEGS